MWESDMTVSPPSARPPCSNTDPVLPAAKPEQVFQVNGDCRLLVFSFMAGAVLEKEQTLTYIKDRLIAAGISAEVMLLQGLELVTAVK